MAFKQPTFGTGEIQEEQKLIKTSGFKDEVSGQTNLIDHYISISILLFRATTFKIRQPKAHFRII